MQCLALQYPGFTLSGSIPQVGWGAGHRASPALGLSQRKAGGCQTKRAVYSTCSILCLSETPSMQTPISSSPKVSIWAEICLTGFAISFETSAQFLYACSFLKAEQREYLALKTSWKLEMKNCMTTVQL